MLELKNIHLRIDDEGENGENIEILKGIDLKLEPGRLYGITGPNGGGKTSLAKVIMGIYRPYKGQVYLDNEDITDLSVSERAQKGISYAFQTPPRFKGLTIADILGIASAHADDKKIRQKIRQVGLCPEDYLDRDFGANLSGGEIKRLEVAQILLRNTRVSIFDEPEAGVDLWTIQKLINILVKSYKNNPDKIAVVISHNENILPICDEIIVINDGKIKGQGTADQIWHLISDEIECKVRRQCRGDINL